jgi:hypothetical protein
MRGTQTPGGPTNRWISCLCLRGSRDERNEAMLPIEDRRAIVLCIDHHQSGGHLPGVRQNPPKGVGQKQTAHARLVNGPRQSADQRCGGGRIARQLTISLCSGGGGQVPKQRLRAEACNPSGARHSRSDE